MKCEAGLEINPNVLKHVIILLIQPYVYFISSTDWILKQLAVCRMRINPVKDFNGSTTYYFS